MPSYVGTEGADIYEVLPGDTVSARGGDDTFDWSFYAGDRSADGGGGVDTLNLLSVFGYFVDLESDSVRNGDVWGGFSDPAGTVTNVENVRAGASGSFHIEVYGNAAANEFRVDPFYDDPVYAPGGRQSGAVFDGRGGDDKLYGGAGADDLRGGDGADFLSGGGRDDLLSGGKGNDDLNGGSGSDTMTGGVGNDRYTIDNIGDTIIENLGQGTDTVLSSLTFNGSSTVNANIENITLTGSSGANAVGNALANILTGNNANNALNGGAGADRLIGGLGSDVYTVDNAGDLVVEGAGAGTDRVQSTVSQTLAANVENLTLLGSAGSYGIGNDQANTIIGNAGANVIAGKGGADNLTGGAGSDTFDYNTVAESSYSAYDRITDLTNSDRIDLSGIDANANLAGNQAFSLVNAFTNVAGQATLIYNASAKFTVLAADINGDGTADLRIVINGDHHDFTNFAF